MPCTFTLTTAKNPLELYSWAISQASIHNVLHTGSAQQGLFSFYFMGGQFKGSYKVFGQTIIINFKKKPILIPCAVIEKFLKSHI